MGEFHLIIDASAVYSSDAPLLEILLDGNVVSSGLITEQSGSGLTSLEFTLPFSGEYPSSLSFRFLDGSAESGRSIEIDRVAINYQDVDTTYISMMVLAQSESAVVDTGSIETLFDDPSASWAPPPAVEAAPDYLDFAPYDIIGTAGDDTMSGNWINGQEDHMDGGAGNDSLRGETKSDYIWGGTGDDFLRGDLGDDYIVGAEDDDKILGDDGNDRLWGHLGRDRIFGGTGDDFISGNEGRDFLYGQEDNDTIYGGDDNDVLFGDDGDDTLYGGEGADKLYGGTGNNLLYGGNGNDKIWMDGGTGTGYGGDGNDKLYGEFGVDDTMYGENGDDVLAGYSGNDTLYGGDGYDRMYGHDGNDSIFGEAGDDFILAHDGTDVVDGGAGDDTIFSEAGSDNLSGGADNDVINGGADADTINGDDGDDVLVGAGGQDTLDGGAGNDILHGGGISKVDANQLTKADATLVFSAETNSFYRWVTVADTWTNAEAAAQAATLNGLTGHLVTITTQAEQDYIYNLISGQPDRIWLGGSDSAVEGEWRWSGGVEDGIQFSSDSTAVNGMYSLWGTAQPNNGTGDEHYATIWRNGGGNDQYWNDEANTDTFNYVIEWDAGLMVDDGLRDDLYGGSGDDTLYGHGGNDRLYGENDSDKVYGGDGADYIEGGSGDDYLYGQEGNDTILGGSGNDLIDAGNGNDTVDGETGTDTITFERASASISIDLGDTATQSTSGAGFITLSNVENFIGSIYIDAVTVSGVTNVVNGYLGDDLFIVDGTDAYGDTFIGGEGTDTIQNFHIGEAYAGSRALRFDGNVVFDSIEEIDAGGQDIRVLSDSTIDFSGITTMTDVVAIVGTGGAETITGSQDDDVIDVKGGDDVVYGGAGNDTIYSGGGNDTIYGGAGNDIIYDGSGAADVLDGGSQSDIFIVDGTQGRDTTFIGGGGNDVIRNFEDGQPYDSAYALRFDSGTSFSSIEEIDANNQDIMLSGATTIDFSGITKMRQVVQILGSSGADNITGSQDAETINGGNKNDIIDGQGDDDTIYGGAGNDTINGGLGADALYGDAGDDTFDFDTLDAVDTIYDFTSSDDSLDISDLLTGFVPGTSDINDFVQFTEVSGDTIVSIDTNGTAGGASFTNMASLDSTTGLDLNTLYANGQIIV